MCSVQLEQSCTLCSQSEKQYALCSQSEHRAFYVANQSTHWFYAANQSSHALCAANHSSRAFCVRAALSVCPAQIKGFLKRRSSREILVKVRLGSLWPVKVSHFPARFPLPLPAPRDAGARVLTSERPTRSTELMYVGVYAIMMYRYQYTVRWDTRMPQSGRHPSMARRGTAHSGARSCKRAGQREGSTARRRSDAPTQTRDGAPGSPGTCCAARERTT